jgi:hypothetical protein
LSTAISCWSRTEDKKDGIAGLTEDRPVKVTLELPATVHRDLVAYAELLGQQNANPISDPTKLIAPIVARFMATDRAFVRSRKLRLKAKS